nr:unnamed protein product [Digitaria exilis]
MSCSPEAALLLLVTLARHRRFAAAATLFSTARCSTTGALNSLLAALCSPTSSYPASFLRIAPSVLLRAAPHAAPDAATFRILTSALCRAHQPTAAADLLRCMPGLLLDPEPRHCRAVLASLCRFAPAPDALAFLDDMRRWGVSPSRPDHGAVLDALLREGMVPEAYELVAKQMDSYDGVAPGLPEFERVLRAFRESGSSVAWLLEMWTRRGRWRGRPSGGACGGMRRRCRSWWPRCVKAGIWRRRGGCCWTSCAARMDASAFERLINGQGGTLPDEAAGVVGQAVGEP